MNSPNRIFNTLAAATAITLATQSALALGSDYYNKPVTASTNWPKGLDTLVNITNRVHGYWVNQEDTFFFTGNASDFTAFLRDFFRLEGTGVSKRLVLHDGVGEARSPWHKTGRPCDWKLYACPKGWRNFSVLATQGTNSPAVLRQAAQEPGYILDVHFWTGGRIPFNEVTVPKTLEIKKQ